MNAPRVATVSSYLKAEPKALQPALKRLRETILEAVPKLEEKISYGMPTFKHKGKNMIHFAAYKTHIGLYPGPIAIRAFAKELAKYETAKGTIRFPLEKPLPYLLIARIAKASAQRIDAKK